LNVRDFFRNMPINYLVQREDQPDFPHILIGYFEPFQSPSVWLDGLISLTNAQITENVEDGQPVCETSENVRTPFPGAIPDLWEDFMIGIENFCQNLPDYVGAVVFVIDPPDVGNPEDWQRRVHFLAEQIKSPWLKFLVLEPRDSEPLADLADHPRVDTLLFWMSPEEIERRADNGLRMSGGLEGYIT